MPVLFGEMFITMFRLNPSISYTFQPLDNDSGLGWSDSSEEPAKKFYKTTDGLRRRRVGRGGRLLFDCRTQLSKSPDAEYKKFDVAPKIPLKKLSSSNESFTLSRISDIPEDYITFEIVTEPAEIFNSNKTFS